LRATRRGSRLGRRGSTTARWRIATAVGSS